MRRETRSMGNRNWGMRRPDTVLAAVLLLWVGCSCEPGPARFDPEVILNEFGLVRTDTIDLASVGLVSDIVIGDYDPMPGDEIVVAGTKGATVLDRDFGIIRSIAFESSDSGFRYVTDVEGDGSPEFVSVSDVGDLVLEDATGAKLWTRNTAWDRGSVEFAEGTFGDVDGDGDVEFVIYVGEFVDTIEAPINREIVLLDHRGDQIIRFADDGVLDVFLVDVVGTEALEIGASHSIPTKHWRFFDLAGQLVSEVILEPSMTGSVVDFIRGHMITDYDQAEQFFIQMDGKRDAGNIIDFAGNLRLDLEWPILHPFVFDPSITEAVEGFAARFFRTEVGADASVAIVGKLPDRRVISYVPPRGELLVFDSTGELVYDEILDDRARGLLAMSADDGTDDLVVGMDGELRIYSID